MLTWRKNLGLAIIAASLTGTALATVRTHQETPTIPFIPYADLTLNTYWDFKYQDMEPMDLVKTSQASGIRSYHLAFINDAGICQPAWGSIAGYDVGAGWASHLTDKLRSNGISFIVGFGGSSGNDISMNCSPSQLVSILTQVITTYQPQGLDFDIENGTADVPKLLAAIKQFQTSHPTIKISFTLPVLPEGLTASGQAIVHQAHQDELNYSVNIMAMDYGRSYTGNMGQYAIQAANNFFTFLKNLYPEKTSTALWQMIEVTPMIGVNDIKVNQFTLGDVDVLRTFAQQNGLGGLAMWSVARDNPCADQWASPTCSGNNLQSKPYEFSQRFMG